MSLDTLTNVKAALLISGTDDDTVLTRAMDAAESFIEQHCGRAFAGGTFTETHPAGGPLLFLRNFPVSAVTTLRVDPNRQFGSETTRDASGYVVHADRGVIESTAGPFLAPRCGKGSADWPGAVQVVYTTPTGQVPGAVRDAFTQLVLHWFRLVKTNAELGCLLLTEKADGTDAKAYPWNLGSVRLPPGVLQLLDPFRVPSI